jgi:peptidyl-prolyl cis-trans isomerase C
MPAFKRVAAAVAGTVLAAVPAMAQQAQVRPAGGLPGPAIQSAAALNAALAEFDRNPRTVVAEIGPRAVTWADVADAIRAMPRIVGGIPFNELYQGTLLRLVQEKALALRAETTGLAKDPDIRRRIKNAEDTALAEAMLQKSLAPNVTEAALRAVYDGAVAGKVTVPEVRARVIFVDRKDDAAFLIGRIKAGASFADLARQESKDGTAANGGDLGYVRLEMLSPEIGAVAFALDVGEVTANPVRLGRSWCVLMVEARREAGAPPFEEARPALEQDVLHYGVEELRQQALKSTPVKYYGLGGRNAP